VTITSQVRYVHYYGRYVRERMEYRPTTLLVRSIKFHGVPFFSQGTCGMSSCVRVRVRVVCVCALVGV
jgi:hypothetical protein